MRGQVQAVAEPAALFNGSEVVWRVGMATMVLVTQARAL